ncbi:hypothetical protein WR25_07464 [Diploscapter pachys]|uniref:SXP/RAL-2 family protein Ani s 5-like cation-binding domain-containing protein n=1 Tax=Diploscapter pachys TaxID=2018661 RepID=A0A2A2JTL5_9BILA|nr:hypothetical protein WR25_07464 [Diploscapter pachys]
MKFLTCLAFAICLAFAYGQSSPVVTLPSVTVSVVTGVTVVTGPADDLITALQRIIQELNKLLQDIVDGTLTSLIRVLQTVGELLGITKDPRVTQILTDLFSDLLETVFSSPGDVLTGATKEKVLSLIRETIGKLQALLDQLLGGSSGTGLPITLPTVPTASVPVSVPRSRRFAQ